MPRFPLQTGEEGVSTVGDRAGGFVQRLRRSRGDSKPPFVFVVNFCLGWGNLIAYFSPRNGSSSPYHPNHDAFGAVLKQFIDGDDEYRNKRFKIIPRCHDGPWVVRTTVRGKPGITGTKIKTDYHRGKGWFEISIDICSSGFARRMLTCVKTVSFDLGFVIEGQSEEELPEQLVGALRFHRLCTENLPSFSEWEGRSP
ncbi:unnamed protein product [Discosporangium mesarthrocarpum]